MKHLLLALLALSSLTVFGACQTNRQGDEPATDRSDSDTFELAPPPETAAADTAAPAPEAPVVTHTAVITVTHLDSTLGDIELELYGRDAPKTVKNFVGLAKKGYYDGVAFHRVVPGFVIQGGDPLSKDLANYERWGEGGESIYGGTFEDELDPSTPSYKRGYVTGTLAMANAGPNTNGSQFFIVLTTEGAGHLTPNYTIFGAVRNGMDVVRRIEQLAVQENLQKPLKPCRMKKITVKEVKPVARAGEDEDNMEELETMQVLTAP